MTILHLFFFFCISINFQIFSIAASFETHPSLIDKVLTPLSIRNKKAFLDFVLSRKKVIYSQFEAKYDPYQGYNSLPQMCQKRNLPKGLMVEKKNFSYSLISAYASKDKVLGDCSDEKSLLKVQYLILYCSSPRKESFIGKFYYTQNSEWILSPLAKCSN